MNNLVGPAVPESDRLMIQVPSAGREEHTSHDTWNLLYRRLHLHVSRVGHETCSCVVFHAFPSINHAAERQ